MRKAGFTIIETLVALVILSMALGSTVLIGKTLAIQTVQRADLNAATMLANEGLDKVRDEASRGTVSPRNDTEVIAIRKKSTLNPGDSVPCAGDLVVSIAQCSNFNDDPAIWSLYDRSVVVSAQAESGAYMVTVTVKPRSSSAVSVVRTLPVTVAPSQAVNPES